PTPPLTVLTTPGNHQVLVSWDAPSSDGGAAISGYTVSTSPASAGCITAGTLSCSVPGLTNGTGYTFTVTATNAAGTGPASVPVTSTPRTVPGAPTGLAATAGNTQVALTWTAPASDGGATITGYAVSATPGGATCQTNGALGCTISSLTNGTTYTFTVTATNAAGTGAASGEATATPIAVPGPPTGLTATRGVRSVTLSWSAPADNGGSAITGYTVTGSDSGGCSATLTSCVVGGLTPGAVYGFTVVATNSKGDSLASAPVTTTPLMVPTAPRRVGAVRTGPQSSLTAQLLVSWAAPISDGGSPITSYTATAGGISCTTTADSCILTGITQSTVLVTVTASNIAGTSEPGTYNHTVRLSSFTIVKHGWSTRLFKGKGVSAGQKIRIYRMVNTHPRLKKTVKVPKNLRWSTVITVPWGKSGWVIGTNGFRSDVVYARR
ncbi:MAG: fibronectin type III domain-containing protein, partial [Actinomycetes bacterium]